MQEGFLPLLVSYLEVAVWRGMGEMLLEQIEDVANSTASDGEELLSLSWLC